MENWRMNFDRLPLKEAAEVCQTICKGITVQDISKCKKPEYYGIELTKPLKTLFYKAKPRRSRIGHRIESTLSDIELERLQTILDYTGETKSELIKRLINDEHERHNLFQIILERRATT